MFFRDALKGTLTNSLRHAQPTLFLGVPRVWEKIHEKMAEAGKANVGLKRQIGQWAKRTGLKHNQRQLSATAETALSDIKFKIADKIVFKKVRKNFGCQAPFCRFSRAQKHLAAAPANLLL